MDVIYNSFFVQTNQVKVVQSFFIDTLLFSSRTITLVCAISYAEQFIITKEAIKLWPLPTPDGSMDSVNYNPPRFNIFQQTTGYVMVKHGEFQANTSSSLKTQGLR